METAKTASRAFRHRRLPGALSLGGLSVANLTRRVWSALIQDEIVDRSAELAYYFLFAMFPALILLSGMFSLFASTSARANLELMLYLAKVIPPAAFASVEAAFSQTTHESNTGHIVFGAIAALWAATYGMSSAQSILNVIYRAKENRPYWKAKAIAMISTMAIFVLVCSAMLLLVLGDDLAKFFSNDLMFNPVLMSLWKIVKFVAALFFMAMVFSITYRWGPAGNERRWRWISPGAIVGILGWLAVSLGFRIYLHFYNPYATTYGSFGAVIVLLTWFYVSGFMLLLGAEINSTIERAANGTT
ncbi:MAG TPA: YihY/virulence factor BrkB family protein [Acidobacteriaceae bacterium]|nr:YihY/virulence factor BrkB family protein [Acidobacteriaceae bacterium]